MKSFRILFLIVLLAPMALAQETYSVVLNIQSKVDQLDLGRAQHNRNLCLSHSLASSCTQSELCVAANVVGGAACTAPDAVAAGKRIYPSSLAGREGFVTNELVRSKLPEYVQAQATIALEAMRAFCIAANQTQKDNLCAASGQSAGCGICDNFQ